MSCSCSEAELAELAALRADYAFVREAIRKVMGGAQMYQLDSGQTRMMVTRASLGQLQAYRSELQNDISALESKCNGGGGSGSHGVPGW